MIRRVLPCLIVLPLGACSPSNDSEPSELITGGVAGSASFSGGSGGSSGSGGPLGAGTNSIGGVGPGGASALGGSGASAGSPSGGAGGSPAGNGGSSGSDGASGGTPSDAGTGGRAPTGPAGELPGSACTREFKVPSFAELKENAKMPDPFTFLDGTKVANRADWVCRQKEISQLAQAFIYGPKPGKPETFDATFSDGTLTLNMGTAGRTWTLSVPISTPSGEGPFPAVFEVDGGTARSGVATIRTGLSWLTGQVASAGQGRGARGKFYEFHPDSTDTGSLMAWAWAASRIIDGLEMTEGHKINPKKLYGIGCSRNGKTAATMALFDQRMAMVAMLSPGSGTTSGWRVAQAQTNEVQTAGQIFRETTWMGEPFGQFGNAVNKLPVDQHSVLALAWPRPILVREGDNDSWNCPVCVYTTVKYTQLVYEALGDKDAVGFTMYSGGHCAAGGSEWSATYDAFVKKYLFDEDSADTTGRFSEGKFTYDEAKWQDGGLTPIP